MKHFILALHLITIFKPPMKQKNITHMCKNNSAPCYDRFDTMAQKTKGKEKEKKKGVPGMPFFPSVNYKS